MNGSAGGAESNGNGAAGGADMMLCHETGRASQATEVHVHENTKFRICQGLISNILAATIVTSLLIFVWLFWTDGNRAT